MFEVLIYLGVIIVALGMLYAYAGSQDVFHPLMFIGPMMLFMYAWMPIKLYKAGGLEGFFQIDQLIFVQCINVASMTCFALGCLSVGCRLPTAQPAKTVSTQDIRILMLTGSIIGVIGLGAWVVALVNVGGFRDAFSQAYGGGWDDNGYVRDASLLMFPGFLLILAAGVRSKLGISHLALMAMFIGPWMVQALLTGRRGPTFMISIFVGMGWYLNRGKRPPLVATAVAGMLLGLLMLFLVTNRDNLFLGSDKDLNSDVSDVVEKPDTGNEFIYGTGSILSSESRQRFYWGRRYLAQILVRPIPHTIWPDKYEDFGVPELTHNAGTGEGFMETLGWEGAIGSAPGVVADLWLEFRWLNLLVLFLIGRAYARCWRNTHLRGGVWITEYVIISALSVYLVMQTMEAVIFRTLILSTPVCAAWLLARRSVKKNVCPASISGETLKGRDATITLKA